MRSFSDYNPVAVTIWFICITSTAMFSGYPPLIAVSLISSVLLFIIKNGRNHGKSHGFFFMLFIILSLINPLVSHNGKTVLFILNDNPVTLEAFLYGINSAAMITGVLYWFRSFSAIMTSDKLLYLTGTFSPEISLVISMTLRYIPLFKNQIKKINNTQKAMGLFKEDNIIDNIKGKLRIFSILVTWALENGIITANSMEARGYGKCRRTQMKKFSFRYSDMLIIISSILLTGITFSVSALNKFQFKFYPSLSFKIPDIYGITGISAYAVLSLIPVIIEIKVLLKWKYLTSKI